MIDRIPRPRVLFICGNRNHTTTMHAVARELADCEKWFTPYYCDDDTLLDYLRRAHLLEFVALGHDFRRRCLAYLQQHDLAIDQGGVRGGYDLVVTCSDLIVPSNIAGLPLVGVQEGMIDPKLFWWRVMELFPWLKLPRWAAGTACTGLSHAYDAYCVASEGYRRDFIERGARPERLVVTGLPNFDNFAGYVRSGHWIEGCVLACTSDGRETFRRDDRKRFIRWALEIAGDRPLVFKFHLNERMSRAVDAVRQWARREEHRRGVPRCARAAPHRRGDEGSRMKVTVVIQARTGSSRLPGKVLLCAAGAPLLQRMVERVCAARTPSEVVVATTTLPCDDEICDIARTAGVAWVRGHETDCLDRHVTAGRA